MPRLWVASAGVGMAPCLTIDAPLSQNHDIEMLLNTDSQGQAITSSELQR